MLQLHLGEQQYYCLLRCGLYKRYDGICCLRFGPRVKQCAMYYNTNIQFVIKMHRFQHTYAISKYFHTVETPSMVDPQWNILYWGSKWNLHTVYWCAVGCDWGTTSVYFGIAYVCFILSGHPVFTVKPQYQHRDFFFKSIIWRTHTTSSKKSCWFKSWMGFVGQILIKL